MGAVLALGRVKRVKMALRKGKIVVDPEKGGGRRRNSLAHNIEQYVQLRGGDTDKLLHEIEAIIRQNAPESRGTDRIKKVLQQQGWAPFRPTHRLFSFRS